MCSFSFVMEHKWISKSRLCWVEQSITETLKSQISVPFQDLSKHCWFISVTCSLILTFDQTLQIMMHTKIADIWPIHSPITNVPITNYQWHIGHCANYQLPICQGQGYISRTFLEQFVLIHFAKAPTRDSSIISPTKFTMNPIQENLAKILN